jgi:hypothetical protein
MYEIEIRTDNLTRRLTDAERETIQAALGDMFQEWHTYIDGELTNRLYVPFGKVVKAVEILNSLGYQTDEDAIEDESANDS